MNQLNRITIFFVSVFCLASCISIYKKDLFSIDKIENERHNSLKLNGYYAIKSADSTLSKPTILYGNGYIHQNGFNFYETKRKFAIWGWGIWWIEGDSIFIEKYDNRVGDYDINYQKGMILSDTTFTITYNYSSWLKPPDRSNNEEYVFVKSESKPDSTNYIEQHKDKFKKNRIKAPSN